MNKVNSPSSGHTYDIQPRSNGMCVCGGGVSGEGIHQKPSYIYICLDLSDTKPGCLHDRPLTNTVLMTVSHSKRNIVIYNNDNNDV